jgi:diguanylate cyclase (GGDEF)-like protein
VPVHWYVQTALILGGIAILATSLVAISRIVRELSTGTLKGRWVILRVLVAFFVVGYVGYWIYGGLDVSAENLLVGVIFFFGAVFVLVVCALTLKTTKDIKRLGILELQSITDPLLGIYNRRYLDHRLTEEVDRAKRYGLPLSVLMLDLDHFKDVNDHFGHLVGDKVLAGIGEVLKVNTRRSDIAARYGGEELVMVLPNTGSEDALQMAERLRAVLERARYAAGDAEQFSCTVSIGVASFGRETNPVATDLLRQADTAMYRAKSTGRNRIVVYGPGCEEDDRQPVLTSR